MRTIAASAIRAALVAGLIVWLTVDGGVLAAAERPAVAETHGALAQLAAEAGCLAAPDGPVPDGCGVLRGVGRGQPPLDLVVSPDSRFVYVASGNGVATLARADDGALHQLQGVEGCLSYGAADGCEAARGLEQKSTYVKLAASADGSVLYLAAVGNDPGTVILVFARDRASGRLRQLEGAAGCLTPTRHDACGVDRALHARLDALAVGPEGRTVYAAGDGRLLVFRRGSAPSVLRRAPGRHGCLTRSPSRGCTQIPEPFNVSQMTVSGDGRFIYATSTGVCQEEFDPCRPGALRVFARDRRSGELSPLPGRAACVREGRGRQCAPGRGVFWPIGTALSPDGRYVYVAGGEIAAFSRDRRTGILDQLDGRAGCLGRLRGCRHVRALRHPTGIAVSPDGRNAYVGVAANTRAAGIFARDGATGALTQLAGSSGCLGVGRAGCASARIVSNLNVPVVSPDGRFVYLTGSTMVGVFARSG